MTNKIESDGLQKLTEYLNQTRRQAEIAIDNLNEQLNRLKKENDNNLRNAQLLQVERDKYKNLADQLKQENTTKHRLQERDDWKSLIDNVQKDRERLQVQCYSLEAELQQSRLDIKLLREELQKAHEVEEENCRKQEVEATCKLCSNVLNEVVQGEDCPIEIVSDGNAPIDDSPTSNSIKLKIALNAAYAQVESFINFL